MSVAKVVELTAESPTSFNDAVDQGIRRASKTLEDVQSAWVKDHQVVISEGKIKTYRVKMKVTFVLKD